MNTAVDEVRDTVETPAEAATERSSSGSRIHPLLPFLLLLVIGIGIALVVQGPAFAARSLAEDPLGDEVSQDGLFGEMDLYREDPEIFEALYGVPFSSGESGTYSTQDTAVVLTSMALSDLVAPVLLDDAGLTDDDLDLPAAESEVVQGLGLSEDRMEDFENTDAVEALRDRLAYLFAVGEAVSVVLSEQAGPAVEEALAEDPETYTRYCLDVVGGIDRAVVDDARASIAGGAPLEELAAGADPTALQVETGTCVFPNQLEQEPDVAEAVLSLDVGGVSDVIDLATGQFLFFRLVSLEDPSPDDPDIIALVQQQANVGGLFNDMLAAAYEKADVDVNPKFGTWVAAEDGRYAVQPPEGPLGTGEELPGLGDELEDVLPGDELIVPPGSSQPGSSQPGTSEGT